MAFFVTKTPSSPSPHLHLRFICEVRVDAQRGGRGGVAEVAVRGEERAGAVEVRLAQLPPALWYIEGAEKEAPQNY